MSKSWLLLIVLEGREGKDTCSCFHPWHDIWLLCNWAFLIFCLGKVLGFQKPTLWQTSKAKSSNKSLTTSKL